MTFLVQTKYKDKKTGEPGQVFRNEFTSLFPYPIAVSHRDSVNLRWRYSTSRLSPQLAGPCKGETRCSLGPRTLISTPSLQISMFMKRSFIIMTVLCSKDLYLCFY